MYKKLKKYSEERENLEEIKNNLRIQRTTNNFKKEKRKFEKKLKNKEEEIFKIENFLKELEESDPILTCVLNSDYDPEREYITREEREEWVKVGTSGEVHVRDNGECIVGDYCICGSEGIAIPDNGNEYNKFRVILRTSDNVIVIKL